MERENLTQIWQMFCKDRFVKVKVGDKFGILRKDEKWLIEPKFDKIDIKYVENGEDASEYLQFLKPYVKEYDGKFGIAVCGEFIVPPIYDYKEDFLDNLIYLAKDYEPYVCFEIRDGNRLERTYNFTCYIYDINFERISNDDETKFGIEGVFEPIFDDIIPSNVIHKIFYVKIDGKFGIIDDKNRILVEPIYDDIHDFDSYNIYNNLLIFKKGDKFGLMDKNGKISIDAMYNYIDAVFRKTEYQEKEYYQVEIDGKFGIIDINNNIVLEIIYDEVNVPELYVKLDNKFAIMDDSWNIISDFIYDDISYEGDGVHLVKIDNKIAAIKDNKFVFEPIYIDEKLYDNLWSFDFSIDYSPDYVIVRDKEWHRGIISTKTGEWIIKPKFRWLDIKKHLAHVNTMDGKDAIFDIKNMCYLIPPIKVQDMKLFNDKIKIEVQGNFDELMCIDITLDKI